MQKKVAYYFSKKNIEHIKLLVLGTALIFLGVMFVVHYLGLWQGQAFMMATWPCLIIAPSYIYMKQAGKQLGTVLLLGNSTILLLYTLSILNQGLLIGSLLGFTLVMLGIWVLKKAN